MFRWLRRKPGSSEAPPVDVYFDAPRAAILKHDDPDANVVVILPRLPLHLRVVCALTSEQAVAEWAGRDVVVSATRSGRRPKAKMTLPYVMDRRSEATLELSPFPAGEHEFELEIVGARNGERLFSHRFVVQAQ